MTRPLLPSLLLLCVLGSPGCGGTLSTTPIEPPGGASAPGSGGVDAEGSGEGTPGAPGTPEEEADPDSPSSPSTPTQPTPAPTAPRSPSPGLPPEDLSAQLEVNRQKAGLPGMAVAAFDGSRMPGIGSTGRRKAGAEPKVTHADKWHLASCTKSMTGTLTALLVEQGKLSWTTTLEQAFGADWVTDMDPAWRAVTLEQLLAHLGGAPESFSSELQNTLQQAGDVTSLRKAFVQKLLRGKPAQAPGTFQYSNSGYLVVGAYLEKLTGKSWESLMREHLFTPLKMASCGFGVPGTPGSVEQPWGHSGFPGFWTPSQADNPAALGPAGTVHCGLEDWGRYAQDHLNAARGRPTRLPLTGASWTKLHSPVAGGPGYALGWGRGDLGWGGVVLNHAGSNTRNYSLVLVAPHLDRVFLGAANAQSGAEDALLDAAEWMRARYP